MGFSIPGVPMVERGFTGQEKSDSKPSQTAKDEAMTKSLKAEPNSIQTPEQASSGSPAAETKDPSQVPSRDKTRTSSGAVASISPSALDGPFHAPSAPERIKRNPQPQPQPLQHPPSSSSNRTKGRASMQKRAAKYDESPPRPFIPSPPALSQYTLSSSGLSEVSLGEGNNVERSEPMSPQQVFGSPSLSLMTPSPPGMASPEGWNLRVSWLRGEFVRIYIVWWIGLHLKQSKRLYR